MQGASISISKSRPFIPNIHVWRICWFPCGHCGVPQELKESYMSRLGFWLHVFIFLVVRARGLEDDPSFSCFVLDNDLS